MKKTIFVMGMLLTIGITQTFANDKINEAITNSFKQEFLNAQNVQWQSQDNFVKATFDMDGQVMFAFYSKDAQLLGVVRNILSDKLPINLLTSIKKDYNDYWISDLFELASSGQSCYYITLENGEEQLVLKSDGTSEWAIYKRTKKS